MSVKVNTIMVGPLEENCYVVSNGEESGKCFLVDPGANGNRIVNYLKDSHLTPEAVLLTHGHFDHICAVDWVLREYPRALVYALDREKAVLSNSENSLLAGVGRCSFIDSVQYVPEGTILHFAGMEIEVIATPGHTCGSCCYYLKRDEILFSGDTLFRESCGRTDLPTGSSREIRESILEKLKALPDATIVYPGHGESTDIGHEKKYNFIMLGLG